MSRSPRCMTTIGLGSSVAAWIASTQGRQTSPRVRHRDQLGSVLRQPTDPAPPRRGQGRNRSSGALQRYFLIALLRDDVVAQLDALVADIDRRPGDELPHLVLALSAEGAVPEVRGLGGLGAPERPHLRASAA